MIIEKHKAIFIHIPKTAGIALRIYFDKPTMDLVPDENGILQHDTIKEIKEKFPLHKEYKKFSIVRNPYDRMVSWYFYLKQSAINVGFDPEVVFPFNFIKWVEDPFKVSFTRWKLDTSDENKKSIPYFQPQHMWLDDTVTILKYENLNKELSKFFKEEINLPQHNKSNLKKEYFLNYYNKHALGIVYERYKEDFEKFNYKRIEKI